MRHEPPLCARSDLPPVRRRRMPAAYGRSLPAAAESMPQSPSFFSRPGSSCGKVSRPSSSAGNSNFKVWLAQRRGRAILNSTAAVNIDDRRPNTAPAKLQEDSEAAIEIQPYRWTPTQVTELVSRDEKFFAGIFVNTLTLNLDVSELVWHSLELRSEHVEVDSTLSCALLNSSLVLLRGRLRIWQPQIDVIAQLPPEMRPNRRLEFAALCQGIEGPESMRGSGAELSLAKLVLTPDGWIRGLEKFKVGGVVDLSAVRFSVSRGLSLADEARLTRCDVGGRRFVVIQGRITERVFDQWRMAAGGHKEPLALIPPACLPKGDFHFVVPGGRPGAFHLVLIRQQAVATSGLALGGEVIWKDSIWNRDEIELTGCIYEVQPEIVSISAQLENYSDVQKHVIVSEFQKRLMTQYGSIEEAWCCAFDVDGSGSINFSEFSVGCKKAGYRGNLTRLWSMLDEDGSGEISGEELGIVDSRL